MEQYEQNSEKAIESLKEYFEMIKNDNFDGALKTLGIEPTLDVVPKLIETTKNEQKDLKVQKYFQKVILLEMECNQKRNKRRKKVVASDMRNIEQNINREIEVVEIE